MFSALLPPDAAMDALSGTNVFGSVTADGGFLGHYNKITGYDVTALLVIGSSGWFDPGP